MESMAVGVLMTLATELEWLTATVLELIVNTSGMTIVKCTSGSGEMPVCGLETVAPAVTWSMLPSLSTIGSAARPACGKVKRVAAETMRNAAIFIACDPVLKQTNCFAVNC